MDLPDMDIPDTRYLQIPIHQKIETVKKPEKIAIEINSMKI